MGEWFKVSIPVMPSLFHLPPMAAAFRDWCVWVIRKRSELTRPYAGELILGLSQGPGSAGQPHHELLRLPRGLAGFGAGGGLVYGGGGEFRVQPVRS
jgi:hypothetical protein